MSNSKFKPPYHEKRVIIMFRKKHKYNAKQTIIDGFKFSSLMEADYYLLLKQQEKAGLIKILELQSKVYLTKARILMKPDFVIFEVKTGEVYYLEVKGMELPTYKLKKKLWTKYGPGKLRVIKKIRGRFEITEEITVDIEKTKQ